MDIVTKALSVDEIARIQARDAAKVAEATKGSPEFVSVEGRTLTVPLEFSMRYDGAVISEVTIRRPQMREWRAYLRACADAVQEKGPGADDLVDQVWLSIPAVVLENLDFADAARVEAAMEGFFGRSGLPDLTDDPPTSGSPTGDASPST